ncbi:MAG: hypothetical protein IJ713_01795 [Oscillibacter sp.]|nr:hypothetical protein [Oscillibacter sp.]
MRKLWVGSALCRGRLVHYYLLVKAPAGEREEYGVLVVLGTERALLPDLSASRRKVRSLLAAMRRGRVTPVTAADIAEDWLLS